MYVYKLDLALNSYNFKCLFLSVIFQFSLFDMQNNKMAIIFLNI